MCTSKSENERLSKETRFSYKAKKFMRMNKTPGTNSSPRPTGQKEGIRRA